MSKNLVVGYCVWLQRWISCGTFWGFPRRASSWRFLTFRVTSNTVYRWLVKCRPILHPISKFLKAKFCKCPEIISTLICMQQKFIKNWLRNSNSWRILFFFSRRRNLKKFLICKITYTIFSFRKPPYSYSRASGDSQWKRVTAGCIPGN